MSNGRNSDSSQRRQLKDVGCCDCFKMPSGCFPLGRASDDDTAFIIPRTRHTERERLKQTATKRPAPGDSRNDRQTNEAANYPKQPRALVTKAAAQHQIDSFPLFSFHSDWLVLHQTVKCCSPLWVTDRQLRVGTSLLCPAGERLVIRRSSRNNTHASNFVVFSLVRERDNLLSIWPL